MTRLHVNNLFPLILVRRLNSASKKLLAIHWVWQWGIFISVGKRSGKDQGNKKCQSFHCRRLCKWQSCFAFLQHTKTNNIFLLFQDFFGCEKISKNNSTKRTAATTTTTTTATGAATITTGLSWCRWIFLRKLDRFFSENLNPGNLSVMQPNKESRLLFPRHRMKETFKGTTSGWSRTKSYCGRSMIKIQLEPTAVGILNDQPSLFIIIL